MKHLKEAIQKVMVVYFFTTFQEKKDLWIRLLFFHHSVMKWYKTYYGNLEMNRGM